MAPPPAFAPSLHELEGICDFCGEVCDSSQDELNAINCTFEGCSSPVIYHQHCVETYLKSIRLDKQRKTGFQCPRGNGRASQYDKPCPGRVTKSHPIHARNDNSKKRRKAKLPEPATPPPPPAAPGKKPSSLCKLDPKKTDKEKDKDKEKELDSKVTVGSVGTGGSKSSNLPRSLTYPGPSASSSSSGSISSSTRSNSTSRPLSGSASSAVAQCDTHNSEKMQRWAPDSLARDEAEMDGAVAPRAPPCLADFGYVLAGSAGRKSTIGNAWTAGSWLMESSQLVTNDGGKVQRPPSPSDFVPLPSRKEEPKSFPLLPPGRSGSTTMADLLVRATSIDSELQARRNDRNAADTPIAEAATEAHDARTLLRPWSAACVAALRDRKLAVFSRQLQELGFTDQQSVAAVCLHGGDLHRCLTWLLSGAHGPPAGLLLPVPLDVSAELKSMEAAVHAAEVQQEVVEAVVVASAGNMEVALQMLASTKVEKSSVDGQSGMSKANEEVDNASTFISDVARYNAVVGVAQGDQSPTSIPEFPAALDEPMKSQVSHLNVGEAEVTLDSDLVPDLDSTNCPPRSASLFHKRGSLISTGSHAGQSSDPWSGPKFLEESEDALVLQLVSQLLE